MFISINNSIDSVFTTDRNNYSQVLLKEFKYVVKEKKIPMYINDDIEISSESNIENFDKETYEENSDKETSDKKNQK